MLIVTTSISLCASITDVINTDYYPAVGLDDYSLLMNFLCLLPSAQFLTLIVPFRFYCKDTIDSKTSIFFFGEKSLGKTGLKMS